jgi:hypothetical protein
MGGIGEVHNRPGAIDSLAVFVEPSVYHSVPITDNMFRLGQAITHVSPKISWVLSQVDEGRRLFTRPSHFAVLPGVPCVQRLHAFSTAWPISLGCLCANGTQHLSQCIQGDLEKIREVCDEFLGKFPLCYAYWKQYAKAEADLGGHAESVLSRAVAASPYSIDLWLEYIDRINNDGTTSVDDVRSCVPCTARGTRSLGSGSRMGSGSSLISVFVPDDLSSADFWPEHVLPLFPM